jgi:hypothetical protein
MVDQTHLRDLASRCLWLSNNCYDLTAAAQMRAIATDIEVEAVESEKQIGSEPRSNQH